MTRYRKSWTQVLQEVREPKEEIDELVAPGQKSHTGYELYHKDFSSAMQHAAAPAKKTGHTIDPKEIDDKVATGPKKPSKGKVNRYALKAGRKTVQIQVTNLDNKAYELNMYIEGVTLGDQLDQIVEDVEIDEWNIEESAGLQLKMAFDDAKIKIKGVKGGKLVIDKKDKKKAEQVISKQMKKPADAKRVLGSQIVFEDVELNEASGSITITVKGISDLKKADAQMLRDTEFSIEAILQDDGVEIEEGGSTYKGNSITFEADSSDMKIVQAFVKMRNQLSKDTAKLIKPKMDYGDLYQERVDGLYVAGLLSRTAKPNSPLQYSVNFIKEGVELAEKGTAYPATVDTLRKIVKDKQHQTVMFDKGQALVDLFTASAMVQVYDALKPATKKKFEAMIKSKEGFMKSQAFAMKMLK